MNKMISQKEFPMWQRLVALFLEGVFFLIILPLGISRASQWLDQFLGIPAFRAPWLMQAFGWLMIIAGIGFALWSVVVQFTLGHGTPAPAMPTQELGAAVRIYTESHGFGHNSSLSRYVCPLGVSIGVDDRSCAFRTIAHLHKTGRRAEHVAALR